MIKLYSISQLTLIGQLFN